LIEINAERRRQYDSGRIPPQKGIKNMNEVTIFNNPEFGEIRTLETNDGKVMFCGKDVAAALGYSDTRHAVSSFCRYGVKRPVPHPQSPNKTIEMTFIPESDVYRLAFGSKLPTAEKFTDWVTEEVLPTIRRTGSYGAPNGYNTKYSAEEVKDIITQEAVRMIINISARLGLNEQNEPPKKDSTKLGQLSPENRRRVDKIIGKNTSYEQAAYEIRSVIGISISASAVRRYAKNNNLR
jgi:prophage antirepressor-like protein